MRNYINSYFIDAYYMFQNLKEHHKCKYFKQVFYN